MSAFSTALETFWSPTRALGAAADGRHFAWPIAICTLAAILFAALAVPRVDLARTVADAIDHSEQAAKMTPHEREEAIATAQKVGAIGMFASGIFAPAFMALAAAFFLWMAFKFAGGTPQFAPTFAVTAHAMLPLALRHLLTLPSLTTRQGLLASDLGRLLPSNLAALLPENAPMGPTLGFLGAVDVFNLWALALIILGMAYVGRVSKARSAVTSLVLWGAYVAVFAVALPALSMKGGH